MVHVDDFDFDNELESNEIAYGYQSVQQLQEQKHYVEDMRGNDRYCLNMKHLKGRLDMLWVLLDNQSTVHVFWNNMFLANTCKTTKRLELLTKTESTVLNEIGELPGVGTQWVPCKGIANILSFHCIQEINNFKINNSSKPNQSGHRDKCF